MNIELYLFLLHCSKLLQPYSIFVLLTVVFWNTEISYVTPWHRVEQYNYYIGFKFVCWRVQQKAHPHFHTCLSPMVITSLPFSVGPICCSIILAIFIWKKPMLTLIFLYGRRGILFLIKSLTCLAWPRAEARQSWRNKVGFH